MTEIQKSKKYDLEDRTFEFAKQCRQFVKNLPKTIANIEDGKQLVRSSGSVHANFIEANESLSRKDFYHRVRICRKEVKESRSWMRLIDAGESQPVSQGSNNLIQEATELMKIFGSIIETDK